MQSTTSSTRTFMKPQAPKQEPKQPKRDRSYAVTVKALINKVRLPWLLVVMLILFSIFMFAQYKSAKTKLQPAAVSNKQVTSLIDKVGKVMVLPKNETPTVITVLDSAKVRNQSFYADAHNGDKVLVFSKKKLAVLYRPSTNQIVNVAPVTVSPNETTPQPTP